MPSRAPNPSCFWPDRRLNAGRYGMACGALCQAVQNRLRIPSVTALYIENPAVAEYRKEVTMLRTGRDVMAMHDALEGIARVGNKLVRGEPVISTEDGTIPRGLRQNYRTESTGAERAIEMLLKKLSGAAFETEYVMPVFDRVTPAPPIEDMATVTVALVTSGGIVPHGNPDRIEAASASKYGEYPLEGLNCLTAASHQSVHGGLRSDPTPTRTRIVCCRLTSCANSSARGASAVCTIATSQPSAMQLR